MFNTYGAGYDVMC